MSFTIPFSSYFCRSTMYTFANNSVNKCESITCSCENGVEETGTSCQNHGEEKCATCDSGYQINSNDTCSKRNCASDIESESLIQAAKADDETMGYARSAFADFFKLSMALRLDVKYMSENCDIVGRCHSFWCF